MHRSFSQSRFRSGAGSGMGEDVNPQAYIVNLADCMLVLAVGVIVALVAAWNIPLSNVESVEDSDLEQVDPETMDQETLESGSYYIEAGTVYQDPSTGTYYIVKEADASGDSGTGSAGTSGSSEGSSDSTASGTSTSSGSTSASTSDEDIRQAKANGAD